MFNYMFSIYVSKKRNRSLTFYDLNSDFRERSFDGESKIFARSLDFSIILSQSLTLSFSEVRFTCLAQSRLNQLVRIMMNHQ